MNPNNKRNSPVPNGQAQKSKSAQTAICDAAVDSLIKLGYAKTSISIVAKRAGEDVGQFVTITRSFLRRLILQTHYEPSHDETLQIQGWASFLKSVIELKSGD